MVKQTLSQKRAEVLFRDKISRQHTGEKIYYSEEFNREEMLRELKGRIAVTRKDFVKLASSGIKFSPFLEIGAEYSLRSSLLTSEFKARGIALDIAAAPLSRATWFARTLGLSRVPVRICADAHSLPFSDNSFPFVFCYQTLHHFPDPQPIVNEIWRILTPGGHFFFAEEPIKQTLNLRLFRRSTKSYGLTKLFKFFAILPFISTIGKTEVESGIWEGTPAWSVWNRTLRLFPRVSVTISPSFLPLFETLRRTNRHQSLRPSFFQLILISLLGGGISAIAQKPIAESTSASSQLTQMWRCPNCHSKLNHPTPLKFVCQNCHNTFHLKRGIWYFLTEKLYQKLYR